MAKFHSFGANDCSSGAKLCSIGGDDCSLRGDAHSLGGDDYSLGGDDHSLGGDDHSVGGNHSRNAFTLFTKYSKFKQNRRRQKLNITATSAKFILFYHNYNILSSVFRNY
jgi:hypothetical protein